MGWLFIPLAGYAFWKLLEWCDEGQCPNCGYYCNNNTVWCLPPLDDK